MIVENYQRYPAKPLWKLYEGDIHFSHGGEIGELLMEIIITIEVWQKGKWFVSKCPELDFVSQGETREDAKKNLFEVIQIQIEEMKELGTLNDYLAECGYEKNDNNIYPLPEMIGFEKHLLKVA